MFLVILINILMGATFSIVKLILDNYTDPLFLVGYRMTLAGVLLLGYQFLVHPKQLKIQTKNDWLSFIKVALFHVYLCYICEFWSQKYLAPAKVALLFNLTPFITAALSYAMHRQKQSLKKMIGLVIGFIGFLPIIMVHAVDEVKLDGVFWSYLPEISLLISVISAAYAWLVVEHLVIKRRYSILLVNGFAMFWGGVLATLTSYLVGIYSGLNSFGRAWDPWPFTNFGMLTVWVLVLILFSNLIYYNVYAWLLHRYTPTFMAFSGLTIPLFAAMWEWLMFGIVITWPFWLSLAIISLGLALYYREELRQGSQS
jgi:drug/metabolite transporter (DMT)-like permease